MTRLSQNKLLVLLVCIVFVFYQCKPKQEIVSSEISETFYLDGKVEFLKAPDLTAAIDYATELQKPLYVQFFTDWCLPCKVMSEEIYNLDQAANIFNQSFVNYKVKADEVNGANMRLLYNVNEIPTLLFLDHKGRVLGRIDGGPSYTTLMQYADGVIQDWNISDSE